MFKGGQRLLRGSFAYRHAARITHDPSTPFTVHQTPLYRPQTHPSARNRPKDRMHREALSRALLPTLLLQLARTPPVRVAERHALRLLVVAPLLRRRHARAARLEEAVVLRVGRDAEGHLAFSARSNGDAPKDGDACAAWGRCRAWW